MSKITDRDAQNITWFIENRDDIKNMSPEVRETVNRSVDKLKDFLDETMKWLDEDPNRKLPKQS